MTPPEVDRVNYMIAMRAFGYKKCRCGRQKVRDLEALCKECFAKLPEAMQRGLKDKVLYPAVYHQACNTSPSGKASELNSMLESQA